MSEKCYLAGTDPIFESSGSEGEVKRVVHCREGLEASAVAVNRHLGVDEGSCWGLALPVHHVGGYGVVARARVAGCRMERFEGKWDGGRFADWLLEKQVSHSSLVPTQVFDLARLGRVAPEELRALVVGGGRLDEATGRAARELGWPVLPSYGLTEAGSQVATAGLDSLERPYREAPLPVLPIWQVRAGGDGRLWLRGEALFTGMLVGDEGRFEPRQGDWFETSDLVELTDQGELIPLGRADRLVKVLGELVDPQAIERELQRSDPDGGWGYTAVVLAVPDPRAGHRLLAVLEGGGSERAERSVKGHNARAPGYARVSGVAAVARFPRSELGKLRRRELEAELGCHSEANEDT